MSAGDNEAAATATGLARLRRAFGWGSSQALVRILCSFVSIKLTAAYLGPAGLAVIAQFNNLVSLLMGLTASAPNTAVVRLTPEFAAEPARQQAVWASSLRIAMWLSAAALVILLLLAEPIARRAFGQDVPPWTIGLCALGVLAAVLNSLLLSALNGLNDIRRVVLSNVWATVVGLVVFAPACIWWGLLGGLVGSTLAYLAALLITVLMLRKQGHVSLRRMWGPYDAAQGRRIWSFFPMLLAHATLPPLATMVVRDSIINTLDLQAAGLWQAVWRLSEVYLGVITTSVSLYFMPRLGELALRPAELRAEVWRTLGLVTLLTCCVALGIALSRHWVIALVFSSAFAEAESLLVVQMMGDVLRMAGWILGFVLVARVNTRWYLTIEILVPLVLVFLVQYLIPRVGVVGACWAYVVASGLHLSLGFLGLRTLLIRRLDQ